MDQHERHYAVDVVRQRVTDVPLWLKLSGAIVPLFVVVVGAVMSVGGLYAEVRELRSELDKKVSKADLAVADEQLRTEIHDRDNEIINDVDRRLHELSTHDELVVTREDLIDVVHVYDENGYERHTHNRNE